MCQGTPRRFGFDRRNSKGEIESEVVEIDSLDDVQHMIKRVSYKTAYRVEGAGKGKVTQIYCRRQVVFTTRLPDPEGDRAKQFHGLWKGRRAN